jgi:hypothetical protein
LQPIEEEGTDSDPETNGPKATSQDDQIWEGGPEERQPGRLGRMDG